MKYLSSVTRITSGLYLLFASTSFLPSSWVAQAQDEPAASASRTLETQTVQYTFPATTTHYFSHGLCVLGATTATASADTDLTYTPDPDFQTETQVWGDDMLETWQGVDSSDKCQGGIYLRPSKNYSVPSGTVITVDVSYNTGEGPVTLFAFVDALDDDYNGGWDQNLLVPTAGFSLSAETIQSDLYDFNIFSKVLAANEAAAPWHIENTGSALEEVKDKDTIEVFIPFNTSNSAIDTDVFTADCIGTFADTANLFTVADTSSDSTPYNGYIEFNTTLVANITALNSTDYWNPFTDGTRGGWVQVCVETALIYEKPDDAPYLGNADDDRQKIDFVSNVLNISVSLSSNFTVDSVNVEREKAKEENVNADYSDLIEAYECKDDDLPTKATGITYNQGDEITICVKDTSDGIVQVEEFANLKVSQGTGGVSDYNYIKNSLWNPEITTPSCDDTANSGRRICHVKVLALARFFANSNPSDLTFTGSVYVVRDGRRVRRNLRMALPAPEEEEALAVSTRRIQADGGEGSGDFEVSVSLGGSADDNAASDLIGGAAAGFVSIAISAAGAALMA